MMLYDAMDFASEAGRFTSGALDYRQVGGSCLVVVKLASLVVSCGGNRPSTNDNNQCRDWKDTRATRHVYV